MKGLLSLRGGGATAGQMNSDRFGHLFREFWLTFRGSSEPMHLLFRSSVAYITIVQTRLDDRDLVSTSAQQATDFPRKDVIANASRQCRN
jgi:hypothetical protein